MLNYRNETTHLGTVRTLGYIWVSSHVSFVSMFFGNSPFSVIGFTIFNTFFLNHEYTFGDIHLLVDSIYYIYIPHTYNIYRQTHPPFKRSSLGLSDYNLDAVYGPINQITFSFPPVNREFSLFSLAATFNSTWREMKKKKTQCPFPATAQTTRHKTGYHCEKISAHDFFFLLSFRYTLDF